LSLAPRPTGLFAAVVGFSLGFVLRALLSLWLYNRFVPLVVKHP
jgi:hypothetical protein